MLEAFLTVLTSTELEAERGHSDSVGVGAQS